MCPTCDELYDMIFDIVCSSATPTYNITQEASQYFCNVKVNDWHEKTMIAETKVRNSMLNFQVLLRINVVPCNSEPLIWLLF